MRKTSKKIDTNELCSYGCGNVANFKNNIGKISCSEHSSSCPANRIKNSKGLIKSYQNERKSGKDLYRSLSEETKDKMNWSKGKFTKTKFEYGGGGSHKKFLIQERGHICENCKLSEWLNQKITLELEHIDGDNQNNIKSNLKLLCPNCHSQTETWKGKNKNRSNNYITDEEFIEALEKNKNIRQALLELKLTPKGGNYDRANRLLYGRLAERQTQQV